MQNSSSYDLYQHISFHSTLKLIDDLCSYDLNHYLNETFDNYM